MLILLADEALLYSRVLESYRSKNYQDAIYYGESFMKVFPTSKSVYHVKLLVAFSYIKTGKKRRAEKLLKEVAFVEDFVKAPLAMYTLALLCYEDKKYEDAYYYFGKLREMYPDSVYARKAEFYVNTLEKLFAKKRLSEVRKISVKEYFETTEYSWKKVTWTKVGATLSLISSLAFLLTSLSYSARADDYRILYARTGDSYYLRQSENFWGTAENLRNCSLCFAGGVLVFMGADFLYFGREKAEVR